MEKPDPKIKYFRRWYSRLFGNYYLELENEITGMSTKTLKYLLRCDGMLTPTNCGWSEYSAWPIVKKIVEEELNHREYKKSKSKSKHHVTTKRRDLP